MSLGRQAIEQVDPPQSPKHTLPTMYDLPSENLEDPGLPDEFHLWQAELCSATFCPPDYPPNEIFVASDLNLYYDPRHTDWYKRSDWFAVVGVSRLYEERDLRLIYVLWQEGVRPNVVIEFLSPSTRDEDLGQCFFIATVSGTTAGRNRRLTSILGRLRMSEKQAQILDVKAHTQWSPY